MTHHHTAASRAAVAVLLTLTVLQLEWSEITSEAGSGIRTAAVPAAITLLAALALARVSCFETRLLAVVVCVVPLAGLALGHVAGLTGSPRPVPDASAVEALLLFAAALVLLAVDRRTRRTRRSQAPVAGLLSPYAR